MAFLYQGYALGLGGSFTRPTRTVIPSQASAALSIGGGYGSDAVGSSIFALAGEPPISIGSARADVQGVGGEGGVHVTIATATVEDFNLQNRVTATRLVSQLTSIHMEGDDEPAIQIQGSLIDGLTINGVRLRLTYFTDTELPTRHATFVNKYGTDEEFRGLADRCFNWLQPAEEQPPMHEKLWPLYEWCWRCNGEHRPPQSNGRILVSMVKNIERAGGDGEIIIHGNVVTVPNFGRIFLGELIIEKGLRRLNMIRFNLGSPSEGDGTAGSSQTNGSTFP